MANGDKSKPLSGDIFEEEVELTLSDLCRTCQLPAERVLELVDQGVIEPVGRDPAQWSFQAISVRRVRRVQRLKQDLGVNVAGAALVVELLEEIEQLRERLRRLEG